MTMKEIQIPILQYILKDDDYKLIFTLYTKEKRKVQLIQSYTYIGGIIITKS